MKNNISMVDDSEYDVLKTKADAFDVISKYINSTYGGLSVSDVAPEEAFLIGIVRMAETTVDTILARASCDEEEF